MGFFEGEDVRKGVENWGLRGYLDDGQGFEAFEEGNRDVPPFSELLSCQMDAGDREGGGRRG